MLDCKWSSTSTFQVHILEFTFNHETIFYSILRFFFFFSQFIRVHFHLGSTTGILCKQLLASPYDRIKSKIKTKNKIKKQTEGNPSFFWKTETKYKYGSYGFFFMWSIYIGLEHLTLLESNMTLALPFFYRWKQQRIR